MRPVRCGNRDSWAPANAETGLSQDCYVMIDQVTTSPGHQLDRSSTVIIAANLAKWRRFIVTIASAS